MYRKLGFGCVMGTLRERLVERGGGLRQMRKKASSLPRALVVLLRKIPSITLFSLPSS